MESNNELLMQGIVQNDFNLIKYCLLRGVNINKICSNGMTHLGAAAETGNITVLKALVDYSRNTSVDQLDTQNDKTPKPQILHLDIAYNNNRPCKNIGYFVVCKDLDDNDFGEGPTPDGMEALEWDMEVSEETIEEESPLSPEVNIYKWYAKILNQTSIVLKSPDNDIARLDSHGQSVLHHAVRSGNKEIVEYLVQNFNEFNVNQNDSNWFSPLHIAVIKNCVAVTKFLIENGANVNALNRERQTPLHLAAQHGHLELMHLLIDSGSNLNSFDLEERSPLTLAVLHSEEEAAELLIRKGARLNYEETSGFTVLRRAVWNSLNATTELLLEAGAKIIQSHYLLHVAASNGNIDILKALHRAGAILNIRDEQGNTPLMMACSRHNLQIARYLLKNGTPANTFNHINGMTALHVCIQDIREPRILQQFVDLLVTYKADLNAVSNQGNALFYAIILENIHGACTLVKHGVNVNMREERAYFDNLSLAKKHGNFELVKLIVYAGFDFSNLLFGLKSLQSSNNDPVYEFLVSVKTSPMHLRELCRIKIRQQLGTNLIHKIYQLPLPKMVHQYLSLDIL